MSKKEYGTLIKGYVKKVHKHLIDEGKEDEAEVFKNGIPGVIKKIKEMWDDLVLYTGESAGDDSMYCFMNYRESGDPYMIFFKHGLTEEKFVSFSSFSNVIIFFFWLELLLLFMLMFLSFLFSEQLQGHKCSGMQKFLPI